MSRRVEAFTVCMMWLTLAAGLWRSGFSGSTVIIAACAGFNTGMAYMKWVRR